MPKPPSSPEASPLRIPAGCAALVRVEQIHSLLQSVPSTPTGTYRVTAGTLAQELGVSRNTIKSDLALLEGFNAPIAYDPRRRTLFYREPFALRPALPLEPDEMIALFVATRMASHSRALPVGRTLVRALKRIAPLVQGSASFAPDFLDPVFSTSGAAITETEARNFTLLCKAIAARLEVRLVYQKAREASSPQTRVIHPLHWFIRPDACLLVHHEPALNDRRNFELARIRDVELTGATFEWPKGFELRKHIAGSFGRFIGEPVHDVRVVFVGTTCRSCGSSRGNRTSAWSRAPTAPRSRRITSVTPPISSRASCAPGARRKSSAHWKSAPASTPPLPGLSKGTWQAGVISDE